MRDYERELVQSVSQWWAGFWQGFTVGFLFCAGGSTIFALAIWAYNR